MNETNSQRTSRIISELQTNFQNKVAYDLDGRGLHFVCEVEPVTEHPDYDKAIEVMILTKPHLHYKTTQIYTILKGHLELHLGDKILNLKAGDKQTININTTHWAKSNDECWVEIYSQPGWQKSDHIVL